MPNLDQTGPQGDGPMTGRKLGRCTGKGPAPDEEKNQDVLSDVSNGRGVGRGRGGGGQARVKRLAGRGRGQGCQNRHRGGR